MTLEFSRLPRGGEAKVREYCGGNFSLQPSRWPRQRREVPGWAFGERRRAEPEANWRRKRWPAGWARRNPEEPVPPTGALQLAGPPPAISNQKPRPEPGQSRTRNVRLFPARSKLRPVR